MNTRNAIRPKTGLRARVLFALAFTATLAGCAQLRDPHAVAQEWVGYNVATLQTKWRGVNFTRFSAKNDETGYDIIFGVYAHTYTSSYDVPIGPDTSGAMMLETHTQNHYVPTHQDCDLTFYTDKQGIITRYEMRSADGGNELCAKYVNSWGGPNKTGWDNFF
jgi:hypothetical protein